MHSWIGFGTRRLAFALITDYCLLLPAYCSAETGFATISRKTTADDQWMPIGLVLL